MGNPAITTSERRERETTITLDIPVHVLAPNQVEGLHEPRCREPDVHIYLPPLQQLKTISERFSRLASSSSAQGSSSTIFEPRGRAGTKRGTRLDLAATMHGHLRISLPSDSLRISSTWRGLDNPELDAAQVPGGEDALRNHPSTRMRRTMPIDEDDDETEGWAKVRIDANDWRKVLSVGRLGGRVIACEYGGGIGPNILNRTVNELTSPRHRLLQGSCAYTVLLHAHHRRCLRGRGRRKRSHLLHLERFSMKPRWPLLSLTLIQCHV